MKSIYVKTEKQAISLIKKYGAWVLRRMPDFWDNKTVVLEAVKDDGFLLEIVSNRLKNDKEVVVSAILNFPRAILFASENLANNEKIRQLAFEVNGKSFIANKKAYKHFKLYDDKMLKETTHLKKDKALNKKNGKTILLDLEEETFDVEKTRKSLIYRKLKKLYDGSATSDEILCYEEYLKNRMLSKKVRMQKEPKTEQVKSI